jgi:hypothetical protein
MALVIRARRESPAVRAGLIRILPAAQNVMAIGALVTVFAGMALTILLMQGGAGVMLARPGLMLMMGAGMVGALLVFLVTWPLGRTMARLAHGDQLPPEFETFRKRQMIVSSVVGVLGLLALAGATLL